MNTLKSKRANETRTAVINLSRRLDDDEQLSGTPTIVELSTSHLTISEEAINDDEITVDGFPVAEGKAVTFLVAGGQATKEYIVRATVETDAGQTVVGTTTFRVN